MELALAALVSGGQISDRGIGRCLASIDLYEGADGPNILMILATHDSIAWLRTIFERVAESPVGVTVNLVNLQGVRVTGKLSEFVLTKVARRSSRHLEGDGDGRFVWSCTSDEWTAMSLMLEPFLRQSGHQYLTSELADDALIEVSYGEDHKVRRHNSA